MFFKVGCARVNHWASSFGLFCKLFPCLWPQTTPFNVKGSLRRLAPIFKVLPLSCLMLHNSACRACAKKPSEFWVKFALFSGLHDWIMLVLEWFEWSLPPTLVRWRKIVFGKKTDDDTSDTRDVDSLGQLRVDQRRMSIKINTQWLVSQETVSLLDVIWPPRSNQGQSAMLGKNSSYITIGNYLTFELSFRVFCWPRRFHSNRITMKWNLQIGNFSRSSNTLLKSSRVSLDRCLYLGKIFLKNKRAFFKYIDLKIFNPPKISFSSFVL